ncbi:MAG: hypothetical protein AAF726_21800 [Planctomycetota bacterium]
MKRYVSAAALPLLCIACTIGPQYSVYGVDLESRKRPRALVWPSEANDASFRFIVESEDRPTSEIGIATAASDLTADLDDLGGVTILLPAEDEERLRPAATALLEALAREHAGLSTHVVVTETEWSGVGSREELVERVRVARDVVDPPPRGARTYGEFLNMFTPDVIVAPEAGTDGFVVLTTEQRALMFPVSEKFYDAASLSLEELIERLASDPPPERRSGYSHVLVLVPEDADEERRARCADLVEQIEKRAHRSWAVLRRWTTVASAKDLTGPDALSGRLMDIYAEAFGADSSEADVEAAVTGASN